MKMMKTTFYVIHSVVASICLALCASAGAQIFTEDFESITAANFNGAPSGQVGTGLDLAFGGSLAGWSASGGGAVHIVDSANLWSADGPVNPRNFAAMIWQGNPNILTLDSPIAGANDLDTVYVIDFLAAPAVYEHPPQATGPEDGLLIEVLRADDSEVLHFFEHFPGEFVGNQGDLGLTPGSFTYTGDGSGDIVLRIGPTSLGVPYFGGAIDDLKLSINDPDAPRIDSFTATPSVLEDVGEAVIFDWIVGGLPLDSLVITPGNIDVLSSTDGSGEGSFTLDPGPEGTTQYTLTATKGGVNAVRMVIVTLPAPEIEAFEASPSIIAPGEALTLLWEVWLPVTTLTLTPGDIDVTGNTDESGVGSITLDPGPGESTIYTLTATLGASASTANTAARVLILPNPNTIFFENFNDYSGIQNSLQADSGLEVSHSGDVMGWFREGGGTIHAVDLDGEGEFAAMIWQNNVITWDEGIDANAAGGVYTVEFLAGPAVYAASSQQTSDTDGLLIEILRDDDSVLSDFTHTPGAWQGFPLLAPVGFQYSGDGSGEVRIRIGPSSPDSGRFGGAIDDLELSINDPDAPWIDSFTATPSVLEDVGEAVIFDWIVGGLPLDSLVITPGNIDVLSSTDGSGEGSFTLDPGPEGTTQYTLTATKGGVNAVRMVIVTLPAPEIEAFEASPSIIAPGEALTLLWEVWLPVTTLTLTPGDIDVTGNTDESGVGSITLDPGPGESTIYTLTATLGASASTANTAARVLILPNPNTIFFENFNDYSGIQNSLQADSGLEVSHSGDVMGWFREGGGTIHAVDLDGEGEFAAMIWQNNVITWDEGIDANAAGGVYTVEFLAGPAVYAASSQQTSDTDGLLIEILRDDDSVLSDFTHTPGAWQGFPLLAPVGFQYRGDGSGEVRIRIGPSLPGSGRFGGAIDNVSVAPANPGAPWIDSFTATSSVLEDVGEAVIFDWIVGGLPLDSLTITPGNIDVLANTDVEGNGSFTLDPGPNGSTTYTLTAENPVGSVSEDANVSVASPPPGGDVLFTADFNGLTAPDGNFNGGQFESGLAVVWGGALPGWDNAGSGTVHAVDVANVFPDIENPRDFAVMIWQNNVITLANAILGSNQSGESYTVSFGAGPAVYQAGSQQTGETDGLLIEILRDDDSVLATHTHLPGAWAGAPTLVANSFEYVGDGSGDIRLRIGPSSPMSGRFGGAIDNVSVSVASPPIFTADFNGLTAPDGNFNGGQFESGLAVVWGGALPGWDNAGSGTVHAVDVANVFPDIENPRDFAVMIWQNNVITLANAILGSNQSGESYTVSFGAGPAVYQAGSQQTGETDGLLIEILRDDDSVLATHTHLPGAWAGAPTLVANSFEYVGDGSGDIRLRIGPSSPMSGRFGGAIDDLKLSIADPGGEAPTISVVNNGDGTVTVTFEGTLQTAPTVNGPWQDVDAESPLTIPADQAAQFGRAKN
jgi:hypothetical protein